MAHRDSLPATSHYTMDANPPDGQAAIITDMTKPCRIAHHLAGQCSVSAWAASGIMGEVWQYCS